MFRWECKVKNKGKTCPRKFNYVGRLCEGCMHYQDIKMHYQPRLIISTAEYEQFQEECEEFDDWIEEHSHRDLEIWCSVSSIKPRFHKKDYGGKSHLRLNGYLLVFDYGFIETTRFDDYFYANISPHHQDRMRLSPGDRFEARGRFVLDRGRVLFPKIWSIDREFRSGERTWNNSQALVAREAATRFNYQPEHCIKCQHGALVDVTAMNSGHKKKHRELYCLQGIKEPASCYINALEKTNMCEHNKLER